MFGNPWPRTWRIWRWRKGVWIRRVDKSFMYSDEWSECSKDGTNQQEWEIENCNLNTRWLVEMEHIVMDGNFEWIFWIFDNIIIFLRELTNNPHSAVFSTQGSVHSDSFSPLYCRSRFNTVLGNVEVSISCSIQQLLSKVVCLHQACGGWRLCLCTTEISTQKGLGAGCVHSDWLLDPEPRTQQLYPHLHGPHRPQR